MFVSEIIQGLLIGIHSSGIRYVGTGQIFSAFLVNLTSTSSKFERSEKKPLQIPEEGMFSYISVET
jgi:hypothetical protein